ncbi:MAG: 3-deoxy-D-manno-octulosonic acid transferase [Planctomycetes bacterium]|nr:3-deoxy-D-manno-octulosonic acid transferase [Planctomycetota bacterium]
MTERGEVDERERRAPDSARAQAAPIHGDPHRGLATAALHGLYDLLWCLGIVLGSPWWGLRSLADARFRAMVAERFTWTLPRFDATRPRVLVHGVSVGEVKGAAPLVRGLLERHPGLDVVISTTTATGLEVARKTYPGLTVVRYPIDLSLVTRRFLRALAPRAVVLVELEVWPNFLRSCNRARAPVAVVNGRITPRSFERYRLVRHTLPQFDRISLFCVQGEEYAERFRGLGAERSRVIVTGNMKADGLKVGAVKPSAELVRLLAGRAGAGLIVAGSTHRPEEKLVASAWLAGARDARLVLVPRHPERATEVLSDLATLGLRGQLFTKLRSGAESADPSQPAIVDTIGELEAVYALADLVYVGGSLVPHGGQNMLEPAAQGRAVVYGPHVHNFLQEAALLESAGASRRVADGAELETAFRELLADPAARARMGAAGLEVVAAQKGATALTLEAFVSRCLDVRAS